MKELTRVGHLRASQAWKFTYQDNQPGITYVLKPKSWAYSNKYFELF